MASSTHLSHEKLLRVYVLTSYHFNNSFLTQSRVTEPKRILSGPGMGAVSAFIEALYVKCISF